jgi:hypothetical protein
VLCKGYENPEFWTEEGWKWVTFTKSRYPKFWIPKVNGSGTEYTLRMMLSETSSMPWDWPVEVNCFEANAYCSWVS